ncbi:MAG: orotate phosphoribosyltransferase [Pyrinomonadaceae bacterium]
MAENYFIDQDHVLQYFRDTNALLEGHFQLSSGLHSTQYLQCALALQYPADAARFGRAIAEQLVNSLEAVALSAGAGNAPLEIDAVAAPAIGGLIIGYAVAQAMNKRFIWTERQGGEMTLRRGFAIKPGERLVVVEDVITTGGSTRECIAALEENGGRVIAGASIIDRSDGLADVGVPRISLVSLDVPSFSEAECPMCAAGTPAIKPGSRGTLSRPA